LTHRHEESWKRHGSGPDRFLAIWFSGARFDREASFLDRSFEKSADFSGARFYYAPEIDWTGNFTKFDFKGADFGLDRPDKSNRTAESKLPSLLQAMRKAAEEARDHDLERKAELRNNWNVGIENLRKDRWKNRPSYLLRLAINRLWWIVMGTYWVLADYGRNFILARFERAIF
jgi:hypothetical protein